MSVDKIYPAFLATVAVLFLMSNEPAGAHPHVFVEGRFDVGVGNNRTVTTLRHHWRFDSLFSSTALVEFDEMRTSNWTRMN